MRGDGIKTDSRVKRQKSIQQIREQLDRIERARTRNTSEALLNRARRVADKYIRNIAQTKRFANDIYQGRGLGVARGRTVRRIPIWA